MLYDSGYWFAKFFLQRGLGLVYLLAFTVAYRQFLPLAGESGLTPFTEFIDRVDFRSSPSLFYLFDSDRAVKAASGTGLLLSLLATLGVTEMFGTAVSAASWLVLWLLYVSIVNVGQVWYGYGWESMLLEAGFLAVFLGGFMTPASVVMIFLVRWMLFRVMFGAGLIKLRGDSSWKDLTALNFHYETQPMPNPLSWFFHHAPGWWHKMETLVTHIVQLIVPFIYFLPQPFAAIAGMVTIAYHLALMLGGNYSWLNLLTIVLAFSTVPDAVFMQIAFVAKPALTAISLPHRAAIYGYALLVMGLSYYPARNMLSSGQKMNASFDPLHLVNTYGAFGSITRTRYEVVIEGRKNGEWREYEFHGKPTGTDRMPPQVAPYHLRLDWQLWFAAMTPRPRRRWFQRFMHALLEGDEQINSLVKENPFPEGPEAVRAKRYRYEFSDWNDLKKGKWWNRKEVGTYFPEIED